jgi:tol-pal system protein YbgF
LLASRSRVEERQTRAPQGRKKVQAKDMFLMATGWARAGVLALAAVIMVSAPQAQQPPRPQAKNAPPAARDQPPGSDAGLQRRVEQLEEQLVDLQVVIGTLESLARGGSAPPRGGPGQSAAVNAADAGRMDAIETQIRALASQLESLQDQVRGLGGRSGLNVPNSDGPPGFGSVTVAPEAPQDEIDRVLTSPRGGGPPPRVAVSPPPGNQGEPEVQPQQLYEQAYGSLLQKDYGGAEAGFEDFLKRHANHQLAGNAQYWLGETYYVRGQFRAAAAAFLKGYQTYSRSPKAPECLLKLAMSLSRLGQKDAACSSYSELATKYPNPPAHVKSIAQAERQRSGCGA